MTKRRLREDDDDATKRRQREHDDGKEKTKGRCVTLPNLLGTVTGGETDRQRGTGQQSLIRDVICSTRFGAEATADRNRDNILDPNNVILDAPAPFPMRWRHSGVANAIPDAPSSFWNFYSEDPWNIL